MTEVSNEALELARALVGTGVRTIATALQHLMDARDEQKRIAQEYHQLYDVEQLTRTSDGHARAQAAEARFAELVQPSDEAKGRAMALCEYDPRSAPAVAIALQQLMGERDQLAKNCLQMADSRAVQEKRAETAEAKRHELETRAADLERRCDRYSAACVESEARAVAAEEKYVAAIDWNAHLNARADANMQRAQAADQKLAELVRWVRQWAGQPATDMMGKLVAKLLEFEAKPPAKPEAAP